MASMTIACKRLGHSGWQVASDDAVFLPQQRGDAAFHFCSLVFAASRSFLRSGPAPGGCRVVSGEIAVSRQMFAEIFSLIARLGEVHGVIKGEACFGA